jgi:glycosyltransferase involved in cell wall biosynthesis
MKISAIIITYNEAINIPHAVKSVLWADEVILVDSNSMDGTAEIAKTYTTKVYNINDQSITAKRIYSITLASNDWILFLDSDERIPEELKNEIQTLNPDNETCGYFINRRNYWLGKWIKHSANYPDYHLRLFNKHKCSVTDRIVHEAVETKGKTVKLKNDMIHYSYRNLEHMISKINHVTTLEAKEHFKNGKQISKFGVFTHAMSAFLRIYISNGGFMDKLGGFFVSFCYSFTNFVSHLKLLKLQNKL